MKDFTNGVKHYHVAANQSMSEAFTADYTRNKLFTIAVSGIAAASAATYIKVFMRAGDTGVNLMDISTLRRAASGNSFLLVLDFPIPSGFELQVLPYGSGALDISVYGGNS